MREMKDVNEEAIKHIMKTHPRFWINYQFRIDTNSDILLKNMSKAFNCVVNEAISDPIVTMLKEIRIYIMEMRALNKK